MFLMASEVMVYATGLEFSYTQAPKKMKSMIMALFLATNTAGNLFTAAVNHFIQNPDGSSKLTGANYYLFFAGLMFIAAIAFIFIAMTYRGKTFIQDEKPAAA
jgi:POT family proton-dependent oligopeptide transporter